MAKEKTLSKVEKVLSEGTVWRAKEILQGSIGHGYDYDIYEKYGNVLLQMGDLIEAGKYLFLSGKSLPNYEKPISLYLKRYSKSNPSNIFHTFPKVAQLECLSRYPKTVEQHLRSVGCSDRVLKRNSHRKHEETFFDKIKGILILILVIFLFSAAGHSIWMFFSYLFSLFK